MADSKETIILELRIEDGAAGKNLPAAKKEVVELSTSMIGLQQANKKLREERNRLDTTTEEGIKKIKELNEVIDKNTDIIKENSSSLEKQRMNVGNYQRGITDALKEINIAGINVGDVVDKLSKANEDLFQGMIQGWKNSSIQAKLFGTTARTALTLSGIGIIIAGLALIVAYWDDIKVAIGIADSTQEEYFRKQQENLERSRILLEQYNKELDVQNQLLAIQGDKEDKIFENRRKSLLLDIQLADNAQRLSKDRIESYIKENNLTSENLKLRERSAKTFGLSDPFVERLKELKVEFDKAVKSSVDLKNALAILDAQDAKATEDREKREADEAKRAMDERIKQELFESDERKRIRLDRINAQLEAEHEAYLRQQEFIKEFHLNVEVDELASLNRLFKAREDQRKKQLDAERKAAEQQKKIEDFKNEAISGGIELITKEKSQARVALNSIFKQDAIKETVTNTYNAAMAAYKALAGIPIVGPVLGAIAAGLVSVYGASQVAKIVGVQFARGGRADKRGTFEGPPHAGGGIDYIRSDGKHRINVEGGENFYVLKKSASHEINSLSSLNQKHGGVSWEPYGTYPTKSYATGGQVVSQNTNSSANDVNRIVGAIQSMKIFVTVEDFNAVADAKDEPRTKAQVI
jgi:hypothetical protein